MIGRFNIEVVAAAVLCGAAVALSPSAAAAPLMAGGDECLQTSAGTAVPAEMCGPAAAPVADMAGVPLALPGPVPVPVPAAVPIPAGLPVPVGAPIPVGAPVAAGAPVPAGAPLAEMAGTYAGKGDLTGPAPAGAPVPGQPVLPGPSAAG